ncbi:MAG: DNA-binding protein [Betaproteobacteria bacterium]|nr:DNA-binding protein [Betaproteobacteria bacterium]
MRTVIETQTFQKQAERIWSEEERLGFINWIAENPLAGDVIPGVEGARKVRWVASGRGKRGGARVIYLNVDAREVILLVAVYAKAEQENISPDAIRKSV